MAVNDQVFELFENNPRTLAFTITKDGAALDLDGLEIKFALCRLSTSGNFLLPALFEKTTVEADEILVTDAAAGKCEVYLTSPDTDGLGGKTYYWELEVFDAGEGTVVATGTATIRKNVPNA